MRKFKIIALAVLAGVCAISSWADETSKLTKYRIAANKPVVPGYWHADLNKCIAYAKENKVPLIAVWSNGDICGHCMMFEICCNFSGFIKWQRKSGCVFFFISSADKGGEENGTAYRWCQNGRTTAGYPYVRIYYPDKKVDVAVSGDDVNKGYGDAKHGLVNVINFFKKYTVKKGFNPQPPAPKYTGGAFAFSGAATDRLEAEVGQASVYVPLKRTDKSAIATASVNYLVTETAGGTRGTPVRVDWAVADETAGAEVTIPAGCPAGELKLILQDASNAEVARSSITVMEEPENSPKNPRWITERTAETLGWGEWTMNLDVATNKVAAYGEGAYTLVLIGGPLWCPDCVNVEEYLVNTEAFRTFATIDNKIACVAIDEPPFAMGERAPSLLSRDRAATANGKKYWPETSGLGYLSRKRVSDADAAAILDRNLAYLDNDTLHGGFRLPGETDETGGAGKWKTGVPCFILLRNDGSFAGRIFQFSNSTAAMKEGMADVLVKRLQEMVDLADADPHEELNDSIVTTDEMLGKSDSKEATLSFADMHDLYLFDDAETSGKRMSVTLTGESHAEVTVAIHNGLGTIVEKQTGCLDAQDGVSVAAAVSSDYFVSVSYETDSTGYPKDPAFALTNRQSTVRTYALTTRFVVVPTELAQTETIDDGSGKVSIHLQSNEVYRLVGVKAASRPDVFAPLVGGRPGIYRVLAPTGDYTLELDGTTEVTYQLWHPGTIGFSTPAKSVAESDGAYVIQLTRTGGASGEAAVRLQFDGTRPAGLENVIELPEDFGEEIVWTEGDAATKTVEIGIIDNDDADGNVEANFSMASFEGDAEPGIVVFKLTIRDNDRPVPGKIAIVGSNPASGARMTTFAVAGSQMKVTLGREGGTTGAQTVTLKAVASGSSTPLAEKTVTWGNREKDGRDVLIDLPSAAGKKVTVSIVPAKGSAVDASRRVLTATLVAEAPAFEEPAVEVDAIRNMPMKASRKVKLGSAAGFVAAKVTKATVYEGKLAPGLSVKWYYESDADCGLVISGTPTKAGDYSGIYRVSDGKTWSLPLQIRTSVIDAAVSGGGETGKSPLNPYVGQTRTYEDVPVFDAEQQQLVGILSLVIPANGRLSAKYRTDDGSAVAFSCASWKECLDDGTFVAELNGKYLGQAVMITVKVLPWGSVTVEFAGVGYACEMPATSWTKKNHAGDFRGYYTCALPLGNLRAGGAVLTTGTGYALLKMNTASAYYVGRFTFAGMLPNGSGFSGKAVITPRDWKDNEGKGFWNRGILPIVCASKTDTLLGVLELTPGAYDANAKDFVDDGTSYLRTGRCHYKNMRRTVRVAKETPNLLYWKHVDYTDAVSFETSLDAYGAYYNPADKFYTDCNAALGSYKLSFFAYGEDDPIVKEDGDFSFKLGEILNLTETALAGVNVTWNKTKKANAIASTATAVKMSFAPATGLVSGTFVRKFELKNVTMTYRGVVMPGFGYADCSTCGPNAKDKEAALCPFIAGSAWCDDQFTYPGDKDVPRSIIVRRSYPISVGVTAGQ